MDWDLLMGVLGGTTGGIAIKGLWDHLTSRHETATQDGASIRQELWGRIEALETRQQEMSQDIDKWQGLYYETKRQNELLKQENEMLKALQTRLEQENETLTARYEALERRLEQLTDET